MREIVVVRGGGDLATGTIYRLHRAGFRVVVLESPRPTAIRRKAAFSEAVRLGTMTVEGVTARRVEWVSRSGEDARNAALIGEINRCWQRGEIPVIVDPEAECVKILRPTVVVDAIIAKKNLGTSKTMAPLTVALGPGFVAGKGAEADVDVVIETMRGHHLGRLIYEGNAIPNTGVPGLIAGEGARRVIHAPAAGVICNRVDIGAIVEEGQIIAAIAAPDREDEEAKQFTQREDVVPTPVYASLTGVLRGIIQDGFEVWKGMKIADIDPRLEQGKNCDTISDKARAIAGGVLEAVEHFIYMESSVSEDDPVRKGSGRRI